MIKENVSGLYQGTRDILWALNPESDIDQGNRTQAGKSRVLIYSRILEFVFPMKIYSDNLKNVKLPGKL